jgi:hypothetical protein
MPASPPVETVGLEVIVAMRIGDGAAFSVTIGIGQRQKDLPGKNRILLIAGERVKHAQIGDICRALLERAVEVPLPFPLAGGVLISPLEGGKGPGAIRLQFVCGHIERFRDALITPGLQFFEGGLQTRVGRDGSFVGSHILVVPESARVSRTPAGACLLLQARRFVRTMNLQHSRRRGLLRATVHVSMTSCNPSKLS